MDKILKLYPLPAAEIPMAGAYLAHNLRQHSEQTGKPFVYANFIVSLDGRIAIPHPRGKGLKVPKTTATERDWRMFQELAAQADVILSSGRYLRDWAEGRAQEILQIDDPRFADLREWRLSRGLPAQPDIALISGTLDFPIPPVLTAGGRRALVFTMRIGPGAGERDRGPGRSGDRRRGAKRGREALVQHLAELGYRTIYSAPAPGSCISWSPQVWWTGSI
jgi:hypothetical protein